MHLLEMLLYVGLYCHLINNKLYGKHYGFRCHFSTNHELVSLTERIKFITRLILLLEYLLILEKAFDPVIHNILCDKIDYYGIRGVNELVKSYLMNRKQYISANGFDSGISRGVPQGSSLGVLLFLMHVNDFRLCLNKTEASHFAYNTFIMYSSRKIRTIETVMNYQLKLVT